MGLAISKRMASHGVECVVVLNTVICLPKLLIHDAERLKVGPLSTAFTPDCWEDYAIPRCDYGFFVDENVLVDGY